MKALSIRQPWAWLIVYAGKDIENRDWPTHFRGQFLIHASGGMTQYEYESTAVFVRELGIILPPKSALDRGGIVGQAEIIDCVTQSDSPWFFGRHGFVLRNIKPLPFLRFKGTLKFFDVSDEFLQNEAVFSRASELVSGIAR